MRFGMATTAIHTGSATPTMAMLVVTFMVEELLRTLLGPTTPQLLMMAIFACTLTRGWLPALPTLLILGVVASALNGLPLGLPSLVFMSMQLLLSRYQAVLERQPLSLLVGAFAASLLLITLGENMVLVMMDWSAFSMDVLWRWLLTVAIFPLFLGLHMAILGQR